jgi:integrase/recombinase XerD
MTAIDTLIETYLTACEVEGKAATTLYSYAETLRDFRSAGAELDLPDEIEDYGVQEAYAYLGHVRARAAKPAYQHRRHRETKAFFSWCRRMGVIDDNPFARIPLVKLEQPVIQPLSSEEITRLLGGLKPGTRQGVRNRAMILLLLDTGVRASECIRIGIDDVDWPRRRIRIRHAKGGKERWVAFGERCEQALRDYVEHFRPEVGGALFRSLRKNAEMRTDALNKMLGPLARRTGVANVHPHRFRHTFATYCIRAGAREVDVQQLLGHSSLAMVQRYSRTYSSEEAVRAHAAFSPVAALGDAARS